MIKPTGYVDGEFAMDIVDLHGNRLSLNSDAGRRLITDLCRYAEGILSERAVKRRWPLDAATWDRLGNDDALVEVIENERLRRAFDGRAKRERAQQLVVQAPNILNDIMLSHASPRHRVDAVKALDSLATSGPETTATPPADRFQIIINLGGDEVLTFDKSRHVGPDPQMKTIANNDLVDDTTPQELPPWGTFLND